MSSEDAKTIERKIKSNLRKAQNNMFSGKNEEAWTMLEDIDGDIEHLRSIDAGYRGITPLERNYNKLKGDLEKKLGKRSGVPKKNKPHAVKPKKLVPSIQEKASPKSNVDKNTLPSGVIKRLKEISKPLSETENLLKNAKNNSDTNKANRQIKLAERKYQEIERMYSEHINHPKVLEAKENISTIKEEIQELSKKVLSAGVEKRLKDMKRPLSRALDKIEQAENISDIENATYQLKLAQGSYEDIERMYQDQINHPEVVVAKSKLDSVIKKLESASDRIKAKVKQAEQAEAKIEELSKEWVQRINPYLLSGGVPEKQLNLSRINGRDNFLHQINLLDEAKNLLEEFQTTDWSMGKSLKLEQAEEKLASMINDGKETLDQSIKSVIAEAEAVIEERLTWFKNNNNWRNDSSIRPAWLYTRDRENIEDKMQTVKELVPEIIPNSHPDLILLENKLKELMTENEERLAVIPSRTFMIPDKFIGEGSTELKSKAGELVKEKVPDATILKVHLIRENWRVEDVIEHTDTSRTAIRHRITYHLPAQVAAKIGEQVFLYNTHIAKNQRPGGSFGPLTGNLEDYPQIIDAGNLPE